MKTKCFCGGNSSVYEKGEKIYVLDVRLGDKLKECTIIRFDNTVNAYEVKENSIIKKKDKFDGCVVIYGGKKIWVLSQQIFHK